MLDSQFKFIKLTIFVRSKQIFKQIIGQETSGGNLMK